MDKMGSMLCYYMYSYRFCLMIIVLNKLTLNCNIKQMPGKGYWYCPIFERGLIWAE